MGLQGYRKKRNFAKTPEPKAATTRTKERIFVVQEHHARHLHYDFRLEAFGTLKSWAVPKGPSMEVGERRLAVEVEDHPLEYASFSGRIPEGEYGAGTVKIWDKGTWVPPKNLRQAFKEGRLEFELRGKKLKGRWILIRTAGNETASKKWLLIKGHDLPKEKEGREKKAEGQRAAFPDKISPQLASLSNKVPRGSHWIYEIKMDGYRTFARISGRQIQMLTRNSLDWTEKYPQLVRSLKQLKVRNALIDGEVILKDSEGRSSFNKLQWALSHGDLGNFEYCVFDLLYLDGRDLRQESLRVRRSLLQQLLKASKLKNIYLSEAVQVGGEELFRRACAQGYEGIISKDLRKPYEMVRNTNWIKTKCKLQQEFVIGGYTDPDGSRLHFGALLLGVYEGKKLRYVGRVGTGFDQESLIEISKSLRRFQSAQNPFNLGSPGTGKDIHWLRPSLVAEVAFRSWTAEGLLRQASFVAIRGDKTAKEVIKEISTSVSVPDFQVTHSSRVLYEKSKTTKLDVATYYKSVAPWFLIYARKRPLSVLRCSESVGAQCYFQKHLGTIKAADVGEGRARDQEFMYIESKAGLLQLVQAGAIEFHLWQSGLASSDKPDQIVFDLDPAEGLAWRRVVKAAFRLKDILEGLSLRSFVKTTGGKGLHVHVPIAPEYGFESVKEFSRTVCRFLEKESPDLYTLNMSKQKRDQKIYLDFHRNGFGATAVAPYSLRAKEQPYVAVPLSWEELRRMKVHKNFTWRETLIRLARAEGDVWPSYARLRQRIHILESGRSGTFRSDNF